MRIKIKANIKWMILLTIAVAFSSCYNYKSIGLLQEHNKALPVYEEAEFVPYRILVNDELIFRLITSDETLSRLIVSNQNVSGSQNMISYRVYPDGTIDIPFVKNIPVSGLTLEEAAIVIQDRFKELIPDAEVKVALANKNFTVIGEAGTGVFPIYRERLTIFQALSMSGDLSYAGDYRKVKILRETEHGTRLLEFDIRPQSIINSEYYYIYPNDIIYVQRDPSSFYKVSNYSSFIGLISTSLSLLFTVLVYFR